MLVLVSATILYMFTAGESQANIHQPLNVEGTLVIPDMSYWKNTIKENPDVVKRLNAGDYLPIGQVMSVDNGVKLIVDGAMDTSTGFILWYTLENVEGAEAPLLDDTGIWNRSTETKIGSSDSGEEGTQYLTQGNRTQGIVSIPGIDRGIANLRQEEIKISFTANVDEERFRYAEFEMDIPIFPEKPVKRIDVNEYFTIQDQAYYVKYIAISTQNTRIRVEAVGANTQSEADEAVERLVEPSLYVVNKSAMEMRGAVHSLWESYGSDLIFESIYYEEYTELSLQVEGFKKKEADSAVFIVDSNTGEVMHKGMNLPINMRITSQKDEKFIYLHYPLESNERYGIYGDFMDSEGNRYQISGAIKKKDEILYKIPNAPYIQPLQFRFYERNQDKSELNQNEEEVPNAQNRLIIPMVKK